MTASVPPTCGPSDDDLFDLLPVGGGLSRADVVLAGYRAWTWRDIGGELATLLSAHDGHTRSPDSG